MQYLLNMKMVIEILETQTSEGHDYEYELLWLVIIQFIIETTMTFLGSYRELPTDLKNKTKAVLSI